LTHSGSLTMPPVCILAGGLGTRLGSLVDTTPKPLLEVAGEPFLIHQLRMLAAHDVTRVVLCVGYLGQKIEEAIGHQWSDIEIEYSYDSQDLDGTLGAVRKAAPLLGNCFLVMYGDTYLRLDYSRFYSCWLASRLPAGMVVLRNDGRWDRSNAEFRDGYVERYDKDRCTAQMTWIDYGLGALSRQALDWVPTSESDLSKLYRELASRRELFGYEATERFYEIGTPASLAEASSFLNRGNR
jgi:NDP-sugar pyrophosphorylase family protein